MYPLEVVALIFFAVAAVRTFSFGVYSLRQGRGGSFAMSLLTLAAGAVLAGVYVTGNVN